ncbi:unnamed protein product, partial [Brenthis ino]
MPKQTLFDEDSEEEVALKTENEYAKKYDAWREKEELHKLEQKYGSKALNSDVSISSDSEDESDEPPEVSEEVEKQFLKTLALLKTKDPRIYDPNYKFFDEQIEKEKEKEEDGKKLTFGDSDDDDDDDDNNPNIFSIEKKAEIDKPEEDNMVKSSKDNKIKDYLVGKAEHVDEEIEKELAPLRELWSDPKLNDGEAFLRDYILNKRYLEDGDPGEAGDKIRDDDDLEEDEKMVEEQGKFERAYNFRFEEPDDEYLKRFPRTMNYIRPKDDRRSRKRAEIRERKEEEKKKKMEEIARLKALKLKEIQEKIAKIKEVTGNEDLAFKEEDIEGDFDPEEHDRRMKALFDEEYYGDVDDQKPVFPDLDEELEIENWEKFENEDNYNGDQDENGPHCEDEDFNMDADYDPKKAKENLLEELKRNMGKKRRNRKKKSKLAELLSDKKPKFVPEFDKTYSEFMEEYYKMDCEDVIGGDLPTRFKYREVVPNNYGLTVEEILLADDKELTQWVPLKKIIKYRPDNVEKSDVKVYSQKAADERLKKKILPSLFKDLPEEPELMVPPEPVSKKKKKKKKNKKEEETKVTVNIDDNIINTPIAPEETHKKKKKRKYKENGNIDNNSVLGNKDIENNDIEKVYKEPSAKREEINDEPNVVPKSTQTINKKKKKKHVNSFTVDNVENEGPSKIDSELNNDSKQKSKKHKKHKNSVVETTENDTQSDVINNSNKTEGSLKRKLESDSNQVPKKKKKKNKQKGTDNKNQGNNKNMGKNKFKNKNSNKQNDKTRDPLNKLSDERLKAYGLNPKKYRSFLKYKKF